MFARVRGFFLSGLVLTLSVGPVLFGGAAVFARAADPLPAPAVAEPQGGETVRHGKTGYAFQAPRGWKVDRSDRGNVTLAAPSDGPMAVISFAGNTNVGSPDVDDITKDLRATLEKDKDLSDLKIVRQGSFTAASGLTGARIEFEARYNGEQVRGVFHGFVKNGASAIFTSLTTAQAAGKNVPVIDAVARSLVGPGRQE